MHCPAVFVCNSGSLALTKQSTDADLYPRPTEFIPERHTSQSADLMPYKDKDVFHPFSTGPMGCIGKNLAYMEIRLMTAQIIRQFDVRLAEGETGEKLLMGTKDHVSHILQSGSFDLYQSDH